MKTLTEVGTRRTARCSFKGPLVRAVELWPEINDLLRVLDNRLQQAPKLTLVPLIL